ncbi:hypothetical protein [Streptomyces sp. NPDC127033]|uniref:hypothetical protein n=1 Tax=Streptomyces sp. NPDC127033 TaxID=3347110 RepID=UPI003652F619
MSPEEAVQRLLDHFVQSQANSGSPHGRRPEPIQIHGIYAHTRIDALYDPVTKSVTIPGGPGAGTYRTPSGASSTVIQALRPAVFPNRTGWTFWRISSTGKRLSTLRYAQHAPPAATRALPAASQPRR